MKKNSSSLLMYIGIAIACCMLLFSTVSVIMIHGALKKFKSKMGDAAAGIETIVDKFKKAGEKYNEQIEALQKDVAALKDGSAGSDSTKTTSNKKDDSKKKDEKKSTEKTEKSDKAVEHKESSDKDSDKKSESKDEKKSDEKKSDDKKDGGEITFKDDADTKKGSEI